jgi:hypothetical protein
MSQLTTLVGSARAIVLRDATARESPRTIVTATTSMPLGKLLPGLTRNSDGPTSGARTHRLDLLAINDPTGGRT